MYTINQLAKMAGITRRTLHYYDEIGLLKPSLVGENGYRYYGEDTLLRLQQILFYRELELPLEQIRLILADPNFDPQQALKSHRTEIQKRIQRLERLIHTVDTTLNHLRGEQSMDDQQLFDVFNEEQQATYQKEAEQLYDPTIVRATYQRWNRYSREEKQRIGEEGNAVYREFVQAMPKGPASPDAQ
jgi:DNA-binding transcriptional MerR regulator